MVPFVAQVSRTSCRARRRPTTSESGHASQIHRLEWLQMSLPQHSIVPTRTTIGSAMPLQAASLVLVRYCTFFDTPTWMRLRTRTHSRSRTYTHMHTRTRPQTNTSARACTHACALPYTHARACADAMTHCPAAPLLRTHARMTRLGMQRHDPAQHPCTQLSARINAPTTCVCAACAQGSSSLRCHTHSERAT